MAIIGDAERRVNTYTLEMQYGQNVASLSNGGWVVTWTSDGQLGSGTEVFQQRYDGDGSARGAETRVNTASSGNQSGAQVVGLLDGGWVVTWRDDGQGEFFQQIYASDGTPRGHETRISNGSSFLQSYHQLASLDDGGWVVSWQSASGISQQAYSADGSPRGGETHVNSTTIYSPADHKIAALADGGWVVTWQSSDYPDVYQQAYRANGTPMGGEVRVNTTTLGWQYSQQVTALSAGGWVVTWMGSQDGYDYRIYQQAYNADGAAQHNETTVSTYTLTHQYFPQITALDNGGWVVTWISHQQDGSLWGVYQQAYGANGTLLGAETQVNEYTSGNQDSPQVTALTGGGWVVTWQSENQDGYGLGLYQQVYTPAGIKYGSEMRINVETFRDQFDHKVVALQDGSWVVTWQSQDASQSGIFQRVFHFDGVPPVAENPIADQIAIEDSSFQFIVPANTFLDGDGDAITLAATLSDGSALPLWLSFNPATRTFSGTPDNGAVGTVSIRVIATDSTGKTGTDDFVISIANTNDAPISAQSLINMTIAEDSPFSLTIPADAFSDVDSGDSLTYSAALADGAPLPFWLHFDAATRTFSGTPNDSDIATIQVRVTATDSQSASASNIFDLTVTPVNDAPVLVRPIRDQRIPEGSPFNFTIPSGSFVDIDTGDHLTFTATLANGSPLPIWLHFDATTLTFSGTPLNAHVGTLTVGVTATDASNATVTDLFNITVAGQPTTVNLGDTTRVNASGQSINHFHNIVALADGGWVAAWTDPTWAPASVLFRRFDAGGNAVDGIVAVNSTTFRYADWNASIAALANGGFVISWTSEDQFSYEIAQVVFDSDGSALGPVHSANSVSPAHQISPELTVLEGGGWVTVWEQWGGASDGLYQRLFDANGMPLTGDVLVSAGSFGNSAATALEDGGWVTTWTVGGVIHRQVFTSEGVAASILSSGEEIVGVGNVISLEGGGFAQAWLDGPLSNDDSNVILKLFSSDGSDVGAEIIVDQGARWSPPPSVSELSDGKIVVVWEDSDGISERDVKMRVYSRDGSPISAVELVSDATIFDSGTCDAFVTSLYDGAWIVTWISRRSENHEERADIIQQAYDSAGNPVGSNVIVAQSLKYVLDVEVDVVANGAWVVSWVAMNSNGSNVYQRRLEFGSAPENFAPSEITLSAANVSEDALAGTAIGDLSAIDPDAGDTVTLSLVDNPDNTFAIVNGKLVVAAGAHLDFETRTSYLVTVRAEDQEGNHLDRQFTINVLDIDDRFYGTESADTISGDGGDNKVKGFGGNDTLNGGAGTDAIEGGDGNDVILIEVAAHHTAAEKIDGGAGVSDRIRFTSTVVSETLVLSNLTTGVEIVEITNAAGSSGGTTALNLNASALTYGVMLKGNSGVNTIIGTSFVDVIEGNGGNDTIEGKSGSDTLRGGDGNDVFQIAFAVHHGATEVIDGGAGATDRIRFLSTTAGETLNLTSGVTNVEIIEITNGAGSAGGLTALNLNASALTQGVTLNGNAGLNILTGTGFIDTINGNAGNDTIQGGAGSDTTNGGDGNDVFLIASSSHFTAAEVINGGVGTVDRIRFTSTTTGQTLTLTNLVTGVEFVDIVTSTGSAGGTTQLNVSAAALTSAITINGNAGNNALVGSAFADTINGGLGNDTINGGAGSDTIDGGGGNDVFRFVNSLGASNIDTIHNYVVADDRIELDNAVFTALTDGWLFSSAFAANTTGLATTTSQRIIYETDTGKLFYDSNGSAAGGVYQQFAQLGAGFTLTASEFLVI